MPNTRYLQPPHGGTDMSALLYGALKTSGMKLYELAYKMDVSLVTLRRWMRHPELTGMNNIVLLCKALNVPKCKMCEAWKW